MMVRLDPGIRIICTICIQCFIEKFAVDLIANLALWGKFSAREKPAMHMISHFLIAKPDQNYQF